MKDNKMINSKTTIYSIANKNEDAYVAEYTTMAKAKKVLPTGSDWTIVTRQVSVNYANDFCLDILTKMTPRI
tara:strand:+ start:2875 stop:3090 length:216 start_codon:yes stop_codon:yes gene_type:complete